MCDSVVRVSVLGELLGCEDRRYEAMLPDATLGGDESGGQGRAGRRRARGSRTPIVELDAGGEPVAVRTCDDGWFYRVAVDEAGAVYVSGAREDGVPIIRAFD